MVVKYGANTYLCTVAHTSSALFPTDLASKWTILNTGIRYRGIWDLNTDYLKDDVVASGTSTYIAIEDVLGGVTPNTGLNSSYVLFAAGAEGLVAKAGDVMTGDLQITQDSHLYVGTDAQSLTFNGFFIMENKIKPVSSSVIKKLSDAGIRSVMVTGDNPLTAISIGK